MVMWLLCAVVLAATEMITGTFYLLVLSGAAAVGAVLASLDFTLMAQTAGAIMMAMIGCGLLTLRKKSKNMEQDSLDIGQRVTVTTVNADGTAQVDYRGAQWQAQSATTPLEIGTSYFITEIKGSTLILSSEYKA